MLVLPGEDDMHPHAVGEAICDAAAGADRLEAGLSAEALCERISAFFTKHAAQQK